MTQKEIEHPKLTGHGEGSSDTEAFFNALSDLYANIGPDAPGRAFAHARYIHETLLSYADDLEDAIPHAGQDAETLDIILHDVMRLVGSMGPLVSFCRGARHDD